ncbi:MAG TPA: amino acid ABC transporter substrate-binding protein [Rhodospirillales bacterium]|nr:amino acid ABC transporter substrate-binding protein [Rhodospirillales bacterium]
MKKSVKLLSAVAAAALVSTVANAGTIEDVKAKGFLQCGVSQGVPGFSNPDANDNWTGIDVDVCRAVAAAVLGDATKVKFSPLTARERFTALQSGEIDMLSRNTTWTATRDTALGLNFAGVNYYDGQGFMVRKSLGVKSAFDLGGAAVCTNLGTTTELNVADFFRANKMEYKLVAFEKADEVVAAYESGRCDVYTTDQSALAANRIKLSKPDDHMVLPEVISKEPLGPVVRHGDDKWLDIVKWSLYAMLNAEEMGITQANVAKMKTSDNPAVKRLLGTEGSIGKNLGVSADWAYNIISQVGNYAESFDRNVGPNTSLQLQRGVNANWKDGGLMYGMPAR